MEGMHSGTKATRWLFPYPARNKNKVFLIPARNTLFLSALFPVQEVFFHVKGSVSELFQEVLVKILFSSPVV